MMNYSLLKKILTTLMSIAFVSLLSAQEASVSKQINQIKRNTQYVYSEATMENESDAMEMAYELLIEQVQEYVASKKKLNSSENILIKDTIVTISKHSWCTIVGTHNNKRVIGIKHKYTSAVAIGNACYSAG